MSAFENIGISNIEYLSKMLIVFHKIITNYSQTKTDKLRSLYKLKDINMVD